MDAHTLKVWQRGQALLWLPAFAAISLWPRPAWLPLAAAAVLVPSYLLLFAWISSRRPADWVTLARALLLCGVLAQAGLTGALGLTAWLLAGAALAADLLDGVVARRWGGSAAGAVLDMEADQAATLGLAVLAVVPCGVGPWVLALPALRYGFVLLGWLLALPAHDPKPKDGDNRRARRICACTMLLLWLALVPAAAPGLRAACGGLALGLLLYSYADDLLFLLRRREVSQR